jgi:hypothetical protein
MTRVRSFLLLTLALTQPGCATLGAQTLPDVQAAYNESLAKTQDSQFLLNIVRVRYRDTPAFLDVASLTTQQTMVSTAGMNVSVPLVPPSATPGASVGGTVSVTPTTTFAPVRGDDFVKRLVNPISLQTIATVASSGWSIARVLQLTVDRLNRISNAPTATGPTPEFPPEVSRFLSLVHALRTLQIAGHVNMRVVRDAQSGESGLLNFDVDVDESEPLKTVRELLDLPADVTPRIRLTEDFGLVERDTLRVHTRSIMGAMFYLSQGVEVPPEHEARGVVTITRDPTGRRYDWQQMLDGVFRVRWSATEPGVAAVKVRHRDTWFFIADDDLESKTTFMLLIQLFNMQAGRGALPVPLLTIPAGR